MIRTSVKSFALSPVLLVPNSAQVFLHHGFLFPIYLLSLGCTPFPTCIITSCQPHFVQFTLFKVETFMYWYLLGMPLSSFKLSAQFFPHFFICTAEKWAAILIFISSPFLSLVQPTGNRCLLIYVLLTSVSKMSWKLCFNNALPGRSINPTVNQ